MLSKLMNYINLTKNHVIEFVLFNNIKTGNPIVDTFLTTIILSIFSLFTSWIYDNKIHNMMTNLSFDDLKFLFYKKNTVTIEGRRSSSTTIFSGSYNISSSYSDRFKAIFNYIILNLENNKTVYKVKESHTNYQSSLNINTSNEERKKNFDIFMVHQNKHFTIDKDIYVKTDIEEDSERDDKDKISVRTDKITISIYSYKLSLSELIKYIDGITYKYLESIKNNRFNKKFIYSLIKTENKNEELKYDCWRENLFDSSRTFNNIFFDGKKEVINKIDFFLNKKEWYYEKGIPYSLGIGLHGPPGTGKTSFIKALANYTNRHIVMLSLKIIKTKNQLENFFFENTYNDNNEMNSISWDKKILVFEDIDCIGDIVLNREEKDMINKEKNTRKRKELNINNNTVKVNDIIQTMCDLNDPKSIITSNEIAITLDDILNLWDGIRETPGRILVISSNHYDKLDHALIRPGRIDITYELTNASHNTISDFYFHLFNKKINTVELKKIKENFYSPAEIINIYVSSNNEEDFVNRLKKNKKIKIK